MDGPTDRLLRNHRGHTLDKNATFSESAPKYQILCFNNVVKKTHLGYA